jgi:cytosine deaminase
VIAGESKTFDGAAEFMKEHGVEVIDLDIDECKNIMEKFIHEKPDIWFEDIGK